jgi:hypothetical protein
VGDDSTAALRGQLERASTGNAEARRRATDALEEAVRQLRGQPGKGPAPEQPAQR